MSATDSAVHRLLALGHSLPAVAIDSKYLNHRTVGPSIYVSGQLPYRRRWVTTGGTPAPPSA